MHQERQERSIRLFNHTQQQGYGKRQISWWTMVDDKFELVAHYLWRGEPGNPHQPRFGLLNNALKRFRFHSFCSTEVKLSFHYFCFHYCE